ncbi:HD-GYP domain-containing protein [Bradyrhizobium sp.]|uniref:HD-GYP domain-containing protein n=1 Tax=Bradyrhizobium sp. TaxID=376 RepID=UPI003C70D63F
MLVHFVTDEPGKIPAIRAMLEPRYHVAPRLLGAGETQISDGVLMVDVDLRDAARVEQIKPVLRGLRSITEKLFVVQSHIQHMVAQAYALGATSVVRSSREVVFKLAEIEVAAKAAKTDFAVASPDIAGGAAAFKSMFTAIRNGKSITLSEAENATTHIVNGITQNGLGAWLDDVRRYHEGTFQHCLLVTGVAVGFALDLKFTYPDVMRLGMAATLHDIGKARIPLSILDKPGRLEPVEEEIMKRHPVIGYELLRDLAGISPEVLDGVRHHHEYLDGSGYPDALTAGKISDLVRLLTISDIFAALIERRSYRSPMSRENAYKVLCGMDGKLEGSLIKAFRKVALAA